MTERGPEALRLVMGSVHVSVAPEGLPPFPVAAAVREEDTYLVLSSPSPADYADTGSSLDEALAEMEGFRARDPGTVVVRRGRPLSILAVVHDLSAEPTWRREWVASALRAALEETEMRELAAVSLPVLGARHGTLPVEDFCRMLVDAMGRLQPRYIRYLWVRTAHPDHPRRAAEVAGELRRLAQRGVSGP
jgi:O-acetyl-ADP-ribose deacetylase (regulator of RNase III)